MISTTKHLTRATMIAAVLAAGITTLQSAHAAPSKEVRVVQLPTVTIVAKRIPVVELERVVIVAKRLPAATLVAQRSARHAPPV